MIREKFKQITLKTIHFTNKMNITHLLDDSMKTNHTIQKMKNPYIEINNKITLTTDKNHCIDMEKPDEFYQPDFFELIKTTKTQKKTTKRQNFA